MAAQTVERSIAVGLNDPWYGIGRKSVESLIETVYVRFKNAFAAYPDQTKADLMNDCLVGVFAARFTYDPSRSQPSTWITDVAKRRLQDKLKHVSRRERKEESFQFHAREKYDDGETLIEWVEDSYVRSKATLSRYGFLGERLPGQTDLAQAATMMALQRRLGLSNRAMSEFVADRPELLAVVEIPFVPSHYWWWSLPQRVKTINFAKPPIRPVE